MAELITSAFARIGDVRKPPQTDATGAVNWDNGYTPNYEIDLSSGDPLARPVERDVMNYMFYLVTSNIMQYQQSGLPDWDAAMPNGYQRGAQVLVRGSNGSTVYRSLSDFNATNPVGSNSWEEVWTTGRMRTYVPMPLGGEGEMSGGNLPAGANVNLLGVGTYFVQNDGLAAQISNLPESRAGVLEILSWNIAGASGQLAQMQRYASISGVNWFRNIVPGGTNTWRRVIDTVDIGSNINQIPRISSTGVLNVNGIIGQYSGIVLNGHEQSRAALFKAPNYSPNNMPAFFQSDWYSEYIRFGILRGNAADSIGYAISMNDKLCYGYNKASTDHRFTGRVSSWDNNPIFGLHGIDGKELGNIRFDTQIGSPGGMNIAVAATSGGTPGNWNFKDNTFTVPRPTGYAQAGLYVNPDNADWSSWGTRSTAVRVDLNGGGASSVFKITKNGIGGVAALDVYVDAQSVVESRLHLGTSDIMFVGSRGGQVVANLIIGTSGVFVNNANDTGIAYYADSTLGFRVGGVIPSYINSQTFYHNKEIGAPVARIGSTAYVGASCTVQGDGNILGNAWGGGAAPKYISQWAYESFVTDMRMTGLTTIPIINAPGYRDVGNGYVVTGVRNDDSDAYPEQIDVRQIQYYRNGWKIIQVS